MKLDIPFYPQTSSMNCGPAALRMVLAYFDKDPGIDILEEKTGIKKGKGILTIQMAIATASLGYKTEILSKYTSLNEENLKLDFYKNYADLDIEKSQRLSEKAKELSIEIKEQILSLNQILLKLTKDSIPIVLLDWNVIKGTKEKGYEGHFVPLVGYDNENVYVHDHGLKNSEKNKRISKRKFDEARKAQGTDEDILIIYRK